MSLGERHCGRRWCCGLGGRLSQAVSPGKEGGAPLGWELSLFQASIVASWGLDWPR